MDTAAFIFSKYSEKLNNEFKGYSVLNYLSSHDDGSSFDAKLERSKEKATKLLLSPRQSQVYYGEDSRRSLIIEGIEGDATLRSFMNWDQIQTNPETQATLLHWQKLGQFRKNHPAIGAGIHQQIATIPYTFSRIFSKDDFSDKVIVGLDLPVGVKKITVGTIFENGTTLHEAYSDKEVVVQDGKIAIDTPFDIVLVELKKK